MRSPQATFIGNATTLLHLGPFTLLTDPNFLHAGERAYLGYGLTSKRLTDPALSVDELPPVDAIVLSHMHGDHWDRRAREGLDSATPVVTTPHAAKRLRGREGFPHAVALRTWQSHHLTRKGWSVTVTSMPAVHSTNALLRRLLPPVMGSLIELRDPTASVKARVYVSGDTMLFDGLDEIARRHPDIDTAIVHLGGTTLPGGFVVTMTGNDGVECIRRVGARAAVPVHFDDYGVFTSGLDDFRLAISATMLSAEIRYADRGATVPLVTS